VFDFVQDQLAKSETGSIGTDSKAVPAPVSRTVPSFPGSQSTLKPSDLEPAWQAATPRKETVPLPRPRAKQRA
jgi:hypothetical protein